MYIHIYMDTYIYIYVYIYIYIYIDTQTRGERAPHRTDPTPKSTPRAQDPTKQQHLLPPSLHPQQQQQLAPHRRPFCKLIIVM